jgi:hypothetical protein
VVSATDPHGRTLGFLDPAVRVYKNALYSDPVNGGSKGKVVPVLN